MNTAEYRKSVVNFNTEHMTMEYLNMIPRNEETDVREEEENVHKIRSNSLTNMEMQRKRIKALKKRLRVTTHRSHNKGIIKNRKHQTKRLKGEIPSRQSYPGVVGKKSKCLPDKSVALCNNVLGLWIECIKEMKCQNDDLKKLVDDQRSLELIQRTIDVQIERIERRMEIYSLSQDLKATNGG